MITLWSIVVTTQHDCSASRVPIGKHKHACSWTSIPDLAHLNTCTRHNEMSPLTRKRVHPVALLKPRCSCSTVWIIVWWCSKKAKRHNNQWSMNNDQWSMNNQSHHDCYHIVPCCNTYIIKCCGFKKFNVPAEFLEGQASSEDESVWATSLSQLIQHVTW